MASGKGILLGALGGLVLTQARVESVSDPAPSFRSVQLAGPALVGASWEPGDKIQALLPSKDVRTFTPVAWDASRGTVELLVFHHAPTAAGAWIRALAAGDVLRFVGPQRSLSLPPKGRVVLFGDETSCAVARAFAAARTGDDFACVLEVTEEEAVRAVLGELGSRVTLVARRSGEEHIAAVVSRLQTELAKSPEATLLLSGRAQAIQAVRAAFKALAVKPPMLTRAYWSLGRAGLD